MSNIKHDLWDAIQSLKGIGVVKSKQFKKIGIENIMDLLWHIPYRYEDRSKVSSLVNLKDGEIGTVKVHIISSSQFYNKKFRKGMLRVVVNDGTQKAVLIFVNSPYLKSYFKSGDEYFIHGKISKDRGAISFFHPNYLKNDEFSSGFGIEPIYSLAQGISQNEIKKALLQVKDSLIQLNSILPEFLLARRNLISISKAMEKTHFPQNIEDIEEAKKTLVYYELFNLNMAINFVKLSISKKQKNRFYKEINISEIEDLFDFKLTTDQLKSIEEVYSDMHSSNLMNRLLQGDVGSGKTAVSIAAAYIALKSGYQVAIMSPTEILSYQHYESFNSALGDLFEVVHLSSSSKRKKDIINSIKNGSSRLVVSTHSVLSDKIEFEDLALVVTDEQHRFGVEQRRTLTQKGSDIDVLVMSATPIPRTLSLVLYGDMSISEIREKPKNRIPVKTFYIEKKKIESMYNFIEERLKLDERAYFVAPTIEDSEVLQLKSVNTLYNELSDRFQNFGVEILHSQISSSNKDSIMDRFKLGKSKIIVSTTVIEVGIDIPKATIIVITHSERFGLSQLHQLRGRVGRGNKQSYCFLLASKIGEVSKKRIETMISSNDGFQIAQKDLEIRGPGEFIGKIQHGIPNFKVADLNENMDIVKMTREDSLEYIKTLENKKMNVNISKRYIDWIDSKLVL